MITEPSPIFAHSLPGHPRSDWETLADHAQCVANLAQSFAAAFGAAAWGELLGRWHDLGKGSDEFQRYIGHTGDINAGEEETAPGRVDHSTFGAQHAAKTIGNTFGQLLAFCIAGHHGSLPDATSDEETTRGATLHARLQRAVPAATVSAEDKLVPLLKLPFRPTTKDAGFQVAFFTRLLFSTLIDADRTATEQFCNPMQSALRQQAKPSIGELRVALEAFLRQLQASADRTSVNQLRAGVLADCVAAAQLEPGFFSLNVPTGGGKTYASLAFALRHAEAFALRRVIVAIPFTSIIEQTADVYRDALGQFADALIEHHCDVLPAKDTRENKMAAENWDAPLIVTTNVQLYESLFAARGTPCRKLHRITRSVIVLDEAQTIPVELLQPTLLALNELVAHYGCTVVLCTATQPALERRDQEFAIGLEGVRPIIPNAQALFNALRRVEVTRLGKLSDDELVDRLAGVSSVLCVVNTRPHAAKLYDALVARSGGEGSYHLSTFMCAEHRRAVLAEIRIRLEAREPCRVISTQLIEAGVDITFPAVYRAPAGFDSIAQAAGRCNREGKLEQDGRPVLGRVYVFETASLPPAGLLRGAAQCGQELAGRHPDPIVPTAIEEYFRLFYWSQQHNWDKCEVMPALTDDFRSKEVRLMFRTAALRYRIIRDEQNQILVPYDADARAMRDRLLKNGDTDFTMLRDAQRYIVGVRDNLLHVLRADGVVLEHDSGLWLLVNDGAYSSAKGLSPGAVGIDPALLNQ